MFILKSIALGLGVLLTSVAGWLGYQQNLGTAIPVSVAVFETTLASKITSAATSMTLVTGTDKLGDTLSGYLCFTLDGGKTTEEFVCGTVAGTAVTGMTRGLSPVSASSSGALMKEHRAGSSVKITDYPQLAIVSRILNGDDTLPNIIKYATDTLSFTTDTSIPNKLYVDTVATSGAANAYYTVTGLVRLATGTQMAAGTATSSATNYMCLASELANQTPSSRNMIPITNTSGKLAQGFWDLTELFGFATITISKTLTVTGTSSFIGTVGITGTTTFGAIPTLPTATPTTAYQVPSKAYVDTFQKFTTTSDIATSRTYNATYQNGTGWRFVSVSMDMPTATYLYARVGVASTTMVTTSEILTEGNERIQLNFFVPPSYFYNVWTLNTSTGFTLIHWAETY